MNSSFAGSASAPGILGETLVSLFASVREGLGIAFEGTALEGFGTATAMLELAFRGSGTTLGAALSSEGGCGGSG